VQHGGTVQRCVPQGRLAAAPVSGKAQPVDGISMVDAPSGFESRHRHMANAGGGAAPDSSPARHKGPVGDGNAESHGAVSRSEEGPGDIT